MVLLVVHCIGAFSKLQQQSRLLKCTLSNGQGDMGREGWEGDMGKGVVHSMLNAHSDRLKIKKFNKEGHEYEKVIWQCSSEARDMMAVEL